MLDSPRTPAIGAFTWKMMNLWSHISVGHRSTACFHLYLLLFRWLFPSTGLPKKCLLGPRTPWAEPVGHQYSEGPEALPICRWPQTHIPHLTGGHCHPPNSLRWNPGGAAWCALHSPRTLWDVLWKRPDHDLHVATDVQKSPMRDPSGQIQSQRVLAAWECPWFGRVPHRNSREDLGPVIYLGVWNPHLLLRIHCLNSISILA